MKSKFLVYVLNLSLFLSLFCLNLKAQNELPQPRVSPQASVSQNIGFAKVEVKFSRPGVKGRTIWGELVQYGLEPANDPYGSGEARPWRVGADENTTISLSHEAKINGSLVPAGTYGMHMIVQPDEWTVILSSDKDAWGSYFYKKENDVLRFTVKPEEANHIEWLQFGFDNLTSASCNLYMRWEKIKIPVRIEFDEHNIVLDEYRKFLSGNSGFYGNTWKDAAKYCLDNKVNMEEGLQWANKAYTQFKAEKFPIDVVKADLLTELGKTSEAEELLEQALNEGSDEELRNYGRDLVVKKKYDNAIKVLNASLGKNDESWITNFYLGRSYEGMKNYSKAKEYFTDALEYAPEARKGFLKDILNKLETLTD